jgi:pimeloyl-ACP methyl ester carboxylesterase
MRAFLLALALSCLAPFTAFAGDRCDPRVPTDTLDLGDVRLAYQSIGSPKDPTLLLIMGLGGQLIHWPDEVVQTLCQQGFRVIRYDNRDVGLSAWRVPTPGANLTYEVIRYRLGLPVSAPYSLTDMAWDALRLLDGLHVEQAHVLGASMGGMIAQHVADLAPQRVLSLTLVMTSSGAEGLPAPSDSLLKLLAALGSPEVKDDREQLLRQAAQSYDRAFNPEGVQRQMLAILAEPSRVDLLNRLNVPTLVIHGTADPLLPVMHGVHVAAHIHGAELKLIPGMAHRFQEAFKAPLLAAVLPYLRAHQTAGHVAQL